MKGKKKDSVFNKPVDIALPARTVNAREILPGAGSNPGGQ
jgi:hypothetical protein